MEAEVGKTAVIIMEVIDNVSRAGMLILVWANIIVKENRK